MYALQKTTPHPGMSVEDIPRPKPDRGEVIIEVLASSVCGTDLELVFNWEKASKTWGSPLPLTLGHECVGRVVEATDELGESLLGRRVAVETHFFCDECSACLRDNRHNCLNMSIPGVSRNGIYAEFAAVPATACYPVPDALDDSNAALLEAAGVAMHGIQRAGDVADKAVLVTGAGPIALFLVELLNIHGAAKIVVSEPDSTRRSAATAHGATSYSPQQKEELIDIGHRMGRTAGFDVAFEASGSPRAYELAFQALGKDSTLVSIGHTTQPVSVNISRDVNLRVIDWKGTFGRHIWSSWDAVVRLTDTGELDLNSFIAQKLALHELPDAFGDVGKLPGKAVVNHES